MGVRRTFGSEEYKAAGHGKTKDAAKKNASESIREAKKFGGKVSVRKGGDNLKGKGYTVWISYDKPIPRKQPQYPWGNPWGF